VKEAIMSALSQDYPAIQLIVVDDASTDNSTAVIRDHLRDHPTIEFIPLPENIGNCAAFNRGLAKAKGEFIIDLSADDVLMNDRVSIGVKKFASLPADYGVNFGDAEWIDGEGKHLGYHSDRFPREKVSEGDIYEDLIERYFICSPTMMARKEVFDKLGGYDESLSYEDFDFWIRSSRDFKYCYSPEKLVKRRILTSSKGPVQYSYRKSQMKSTYAICEKILRLNKSPEENRALRRRIHYEWKKAMQFGNLSLAWQYLALYFKIH
jgi:glycosyltransferase involved in cell wall biosynthesis